MFIPENIIVRMPNWIGDVVMALPVLADLKKAYPQAALTAMIQSKQAPLLAHNPSIDEIFAFEKPNGFLRRKEQLEIIEEIDKGKYDLGVLLPNSLSSAWWFWRGHVKYRMGYAKNGRSLLLSKAVRYAKNRESTHLVVTYKRLLQAIGLKLSDTKPQLFVTETEKQQAALRMKSTGIKIGIHPGAAYGPAKCWPADRYHTVCKSLLENPNITLIFFGDASSQEIVRTITKGLPAHRIVDLAGATTLRELIASISQCQLFVTGDSGPMHVAAALGIPLVAIYGSTNEVTTGPYGEATIIHKHVECAPCYRRLCPIDFRCMNRIGTDEVLNAVIKKIAYVS